MLRLPMGGTERFPTLFTVQIYPHLVVASPVRASRLPFLRYCLPPSRIISSSGSGTTEQPGLWIHIRESSTLSSIYMPLHSEVRVDPVAVAAIACRRVLSSQQVRHGKWFLTEGTQGHPDIDEAFIVRFTGMRMGCSMRGAEGE